MRAKEIPGLIFKELVESFQITPREAKKYNDVFSVIILRELGAAVGLHEGGKSSLLSVWDYPFDTSSDDLLPDDDIITIIGGSHRAGTWAYGLGDELTETVMVKFGVKVYMHGTKLGTPLMSLIGSILLKGAQITDTNLKELTYWQSFLNPDLDYTKP